MEQLLLLQEEIVKRQLGEQESLLALTGQGTLPQKPSQSSIHANEKQEMDLARAEGYNIKYVR